MYKCNQTTSNYQLFFYLFICLYFLCLCLPETVWCLPFRWGPQGKPCRDERISHPLVPCLWGPGSEVDDTDRRTHCFTGKMLQHESSCIHGWFMIVNDAHDTMLHVLSSLVEWRLVFPVICWNYARLGGAGMGPDGRSFLISDVFIMSWEMSDHIWLWATSEIHIDLWWFMQGPTFDQALRMTTADKNCTQTSKWLPCKKILS